MAEIAILGAGPAGLMAALRLASAEHRCTVLEASPRVGGMAASIDVSGHSVDLGSHRLHPATPPELLDEIRGWVGDDLQVRERNGRLLIGNSWVGFPLRASDLARSLPLGFSARSMKDTALRPLRRAQPTSFLDAVSARLGPTVAHEFYAPYAEKLYGIPADQLSVELADRRVSAKSPADIARRLVRARQPGGRTFLYPRKGYGQIATGMARAAVAAGAEIRTDEPATALSGSPGRITVTTTQGDSAFDLVLSTLPLTTLARLITGVPADVTKALDQQRTRAMVLVYLVLEIARYSEYDAHYIPDTSCAVARLSEPKNYRSGDDPDDSTVLCAEIPCWPGDRTWTAETDQLTSLVCDNLQSLGLPRAQPVSTHVERLPAVYPVMEVDTEESRRTVLEWSEQLEGIVSLGRQGLAAPDNLHHVLAMGDAAASAVRQDGSFDRTSWQTSLEGFATHVVED